MRHLVDEIKYSTCNQFLQQPMPIRAVVIMLAILVAAEALLSKERRTLLPVKVVAIAFSTRLQVKHVRLVVGVGIQMIGFGQYLPGHTFQNPLDRLRVLELFSCDA